MPSLTTSSSKLNIVADTGFFIGAVLKDGYARSYLIARGTKFLTYNLFTSEAILLELQTKLEDSKFGYSRKEVVVFIDQVRELVTIVHPKHKISVVRDADDNKVLECALEAKAQIILSFDKDLLELKEYNNIRIVHPRMLWYM